MNIIKSENDKREYRYFVLENGIKVVIISDNDTKTSAASMTVGVGSYSDPEKYPGLAHFLEHMLFMGTKKYPNENEYSEEISRCGGYSNAYTDSEITNYYFNVVNNHFDKVLDIFAQFFISPLFSKDGVYRELKAVDSENSKNLLSDCWRIDQFVRFFGNQKHPFNKFGTGDMNTLFNNHLDENDGDEEKTKEQIRTALIKFYNEHYSSDKMNLVVLSNQTLDKMEETIKKMFNNVVNKPCIKSINLNKPMDKENLNKMCYVRTVMDKDSLQILWNVPSMEKYYKCNPEKYISHLLGHEGKGSIFAYLKRIGYATSLYSGNFDSTSENCIYEINVGLTKNGMKNYKNVLSICQQYILLLRDGVKKWIYEESKNICEMNFRYLSKKEPMDTVSELSKNLTIFEPHEIYTGYYLISEYNPKLLKKYIDLLKPENMIVILGAKDIENYCPDFDQIKKKEKWYKTEYVYNTFEGFVDFDCGSNLHLPVPNPFIATNFQLSTNNKLVKLVQDNYKEIWYKGCVVEYNNKTESFKFNALYQTPKTYFGVSCFASSINKSVKTNMMTKIFIYLINDALNELTYNASIANLNLVLSCENTYFNLVCNGFSDKLDKLLFMVLEKVLTYNVLEHYDRFVIAKEYFTKHLENSKLSQPINQAFNSLSTTLNKFTYAVDDRISAIKELTIGDLHNFVENRLFKELYFKFMCCGNETIKNVLEMSDRIVKLFSHKFNTIPFLNKNNVCFKNETIILKNNMDVIAPIYNAKEKNIAVIKYYQIGNEPTDYKVRALSGLFNTFASEPFFDQLRTKENFGYITQNTIVRKNNVTGLAFYVQSTKSIDLVDKRINKFMADLCELITSTPEKDINTMIESNIQILLKKDNDFLDEASRNHNHILNDYEFDIKNKIIDAYKSLNKTDLIEFYEIVKNSKVLTVKTI